MTEPNEAMQRLHVPDRVRRLPVSDTGYYLPWFVATNRETGVRDIRIADPRKKITAMQRSLCWVCGEPLGRWRAFVIGPMCVVNRVTSEPPCHVECAEFACVACPFLTKPRMRRNDKNLPDTIEDAPGIAIARNPGVACLYVTASYAPFKVGRGADEFLIRLGDPLRVAWYAEGVPATREQVQASIDGGFPLLMAEAVKDGSDAVAELGRYRAVAERLLPCQ